MDHEVWLNKLFCDEVQVEPDALLPEHWVGNAMVVLQFMEKTRAARAAKIAAEQAVAAPPCIKTEAANLAVVEYGKGGAANQAVGPAGGAELVKVACSIGIFFLCFVHHVFGFQQIRNHVAS